MSASSSIPETHASAEADPNTRFSLDGSSVLALDPALLVHTMTKEQLLQIGRHLSENDVRLTRLHLSEGFKDLQEAVMEFLLLPCCYALEELEYKAAGSSFARILLSTSSEASPALHSPAVERLQDGDFIHSHMPFTTTIKILRLGYNSDAPAQAETDIIMLNAVLRHMPQLQDFSLSQSMDDLTLLQGLLGPEQVCALNRLSISMNAACGLDAAQVEGKIREEQLPGLKNLQVEVEIDERESSYYLNRSRDRHFKAFIRRFGGDRKQQA